MVQLKIITRIDMQLAGKCPSLKGRLPSREVTFTLHPPHRPAPQSITRISCKEILKCKAQSSATIEETDADTVYEGECIPCWVTCDNKHEKYTKLTVDVGDYGGLLRTIAWVLSGTETCVQHAIINTQNEMAHNEYWVTDVKGRKLSDDAAALLQDRIQSFVVFCKPKIESPQEWKSANVRISNIAHDQYSVITVCGDPKLTERYGSVLKEGFFFELCSLITSSGCIVKQGQVLSSQTPPEPVVECLGCQPRPPPFDEHASPQAPPYDFSLGPLYRFCVTDSEGKKLGASQASAFLTMYNIIHGAGHAPFTSPNQDSHVNAEAGAFQI